MSIARPARQQTVGALAAVSAIAWATVVWAWAGLLLAVALVAGTVWVAAQVLDVVEVRAQAACTAQAAARTQEGGER